MPRKGASVGESQREKIERLQLAVQRWLRRTMASKWRVVRKTTL